MITKAARKYERRGIIALVTEGGGGRVGVCGGGEWGGFDLLTVLKMTKKNKDTQGPLKALMEKKLNERYQM